MAIAIPMTSAFADDHEGSKAPKAPTAPKVLTTFVVDQAACTAAKNTLAADRLADKSADIQERQAEKLATEATEALAETDTAMDQMLAKDRAAVETACEPKPVVTSMCSADKTILANAIAADKAVDPAEHPATKEAPEVKGQPEVKSKTTETDTAQDAAVKAAQKAVEANCGETEKD